MRREPPQQKEGGDQFINAAVTLKTYSPRTSGAALEVRSETLRLSESLK